MIPKLKKLIKNVWLSGLVKKTDYDARISKFEGKYFTSSDYNKFTREILDAKVKENRLLDKSDIYDLIKNLS